MYRGEQNQYTYTGPINHNTMIVDPNTFHGGNDFNLFSNDTILTPFLDFSSVLEGETYNEGHSRNSSNGRRISGGIVDRVAQFEQLALKSPHRPTTPQNQNVSGEFLGACGGALLICPAYYPQTPIETPQHRTIKQEHINRRFLDSYDTSMEDTIKPRTNLRARGVFDDMRREAEQNSIPTPPRVPVQSSFDSAPMSGNYMSAHDLNMEFLKVESRDGLQYSPLPLDVSPAVSYHSSPGHEIPMFAESFAPQPETSYQQPQAHSHAPSPASSHRRSESISSINEEFIADTGITIDDIAAHISGPDPSDGKWLCLFSENGKQCGKKFGRKENIKSHVQTHLGDRQFQCPHCSNRFVRQHDLKRHAKIHSGVKPYPCQCGNSFARHDALTRHRQRGMCIGAFEGVVKKTVKRGRPRKNRPDDEKRLDKSSRTRTKNKDKTVSSASSTSGYSESIEGQSPRSDAEILDDKPFEDYSQSMANHYSPEPQVECVSPQAIQAHSPTYSHHTMSRTSSQHESLPSPRNLPLPSSPTKSVHSYHSPPGLCESSSPAASQYFDLDGGEDLSKLSLANISEVDDEMFLEAFANSGGMSALERDPGCLMGKFEDSYGNDSDIFRDTEDVFFGSP